MSYLIVLNIICFQTQKQLTTLNNIRVLLKGILIDLHAHNFMHVKTFLHTRCPLARHGAHNLLRPDISIIQEIVFLVSVSKDHTSTCKNTTPPFPLICLKSMATLMNVIYNRISKQNQFQINIEVKQIHLKQNARSLSKHEICKFRSDYSCIRKKFRDLRCKSLRSVHTFCKFALFAV